MNRSVILLTVIVLANLFLAALVYRTVGWHFIRGYNEVGNFMVVPSIAFVAGLNLLLTVPILATSRLRQSHWGQQVLKCLVLCSALVALSPLFVPTLGRWANHNRLLRTPLLEAARYGDSALVIILLKTGSNPNSKQHALGTTALHYMASRTDLAAIEALLASGADPNARANTSLETSLHWAIRSRADVSVVRCLVRHGADPTLEDWEQETPLDYTRTIPQPRQTELINAMLESNAEDVTN